MTRIRGITPSFSEKPRRDYREPGREAQAQREFKNHATPVTVQRRRQLSADRDHSLGGGTAGADFLAK
jgi:hypothetical protein